MNLKFYVVVLMALCAVTQAQTYQEKVVAAVIMGEARGEGASGQTAVAEVIATRAAIYRKTPLEVVIHPKAFSSINGLTSDAIISKFENESGFTVALKIAHTVCAEPEKLPGLAHGATHFIRTGTKVYWAEGKVPVAIIGHHSFYIIK